MSLDRAEVLRRASKLLQFQKGNCTEAELQSAADKLARLLRENNLSMGEVRIEAARGQIEELKKPTKWKRPPLWAVALGIRISQPCGVTMLQQFDVSEQMTAFYFVGMPADSEVASYFFEFCSRRLPDMAKAAERRHSEQIQGLSQLQRAIHRIKPFKRESYLIGCTDAIGLRLWTIVRPPDQSVSERALMVVKDQAVTEYLSAKYPDMKSHRREIDQRNNASYRMGRTDAEAMALNHALPASEPAAAAIAGQGGLS